MPPTPPPRWLGQVLQVAVIAALVVILLACTVRVVTWILP